MITGLEENFQLLAYTGAATAGRAEKGVVVIQTYTPEHFSIVSAANQIIMLYEQEIHLESCVDIRWRITVEDLRYLHRDEMLLTKSAAWVKAFVLTTVSIADLCV